MSPEPFARRTSKRRRDEPLWFRVWLCLIVVLFVFEWPTWTGGIVIVGGGYVLGLLLLRHQGRKRDSQAPRGGSSRAD